MTTTSNLIDNPKVYFQQASYDPCVVFYYGNFGSPGKCFLDPIIEWCDKNNCGRVVETHFCIMFDRESQALWFMLRWG